MRPRLARDKMAGIAARKRYDGRQGWNMSIWQPTFWEVWLKARTLLMATLLPFLAPIAIVLVAVVLFAGLFNMARGGSPRTSQIIMRWRVALQFAALVIMMGALYFATR
jgi:uncharacterized BrkB/YihY/UPF0761 family membrane protein